MKKIAILGGGESGVGTAILAKKQGFEVFVSDFSEIKPHYKAELTENEIEYEEKQHSEDRILAADEVMKSPGIPDKAPIVKKLHEKGIPVISEIEFAARYTTAKTIGITGSNGKTTTTNLTYHILKMAGFNVGLAGNIGFSFARQVAQEIFDWYVLELSSFQLDGIYSFRPDIAILLNITPDHLDRYDYELGNYIASKFSIGKNQTATDHFIYNTEDKNIQQFLNKNKKYINAQKYTIYPSVLDEDGDIIIEDFEFEAADLTIRGRHNLFNATCAILAAKLAGADNELIMDALGTFENAPHRLESVAIINGVEYINDSKATNVDSVFYALQAIQDKMIWIAGGTDKGNDYSPLDKMVKKRVKALICMTKDPAKLQEHYKDILSNIYVTENIKETVALAASLATDGDVVLLSPACASFDLFKNYEDRGNQFKEAVLELENTNQ